MAWRTDLPYGGGRFWIGTPAVADGRLFVQTLNQAAALDTRTGAVLWQRAVRSAPYPPPTTLLAARGRLFISDADSVLSLNAADGATVWNFHPDSQAVVAPALDETTCYTGQRGIPVVYALGAADGVLRWTVNVGTQYANGANVNGLAAAGGTVYVGLMYYVNANRYPPKGALVALDARSGAERWRVAIADSTVTGNQHTVFGAPLLAGGLVLANDVLDKGVVAIDTASHAIRWRTTMNDNGPASLSLGAGVVYVAGADGYASAVDLATGTNRWRAGRFGSALGGTLCSNAFYVNDERLFRLDAGSGRTTGRTDAGSGGSATFTSGVVSDGQRVYLTATDGVYAVNCQ